MEESWSYSWTKSAVTLYHRWPHPARIWTLHKPTPPSLLQIQHHSHKTPLLNLWIPPFPPMPALLPTCCSIWPEMCPTSTPVKWISCCPSWRTFWRARTLVWPWETPPCKLSAAWWTLHLSCCQTSPKGSRSSLFTACAPLQMHSYLTFILNNNTHWKCIFFFPGS